MSAASVSSGWLVNAGRVPYRRALAWQEQLHQARVSGRVPDTILLLEHDPVYTLGRNADAHHILLDEKTLQQRGIDVFRIGRGGQVTCHAPGQLVGYPIVSLRERGAASYVSLLEEVVIEVLREFGVEAHPDPVHRGVWVGHEKVAAIGVRISRGVAMHGFALNVNPDLSLYAGIVPCGIAGRGVTSMACLGSEATCEDVCESLGRTLCRALDLAVELLDVSTLEAKLAACAAPEGWTDHA